MASTIAETSLWLRRQRLRRTAIHEAGHAALAIIEGRHFDDIVLQKTGNSNAVIRNLSCREGDDEVVRIFLAGIMAARMARHRWDSLLFDSARDDLGAVAEFAKEHSDPKWLLEWNVTATAKYLESNWGAIETIAVALIRNRKVTHEEGVRLFEEGQGKAKGSRPFGKMGASGWQPLCNRVEWRIRYPNGLLDVLKEHGL